MNQIERQKAILEQLFFYAALTCLVVATVGYVLLDHYSIDPKEKCLQEGGTAVEYPKGTFERCIK